MADRCLSKMCSAPHANVFGRCYCAKPKGHAGLHDCRHVPWFARLRARIFGRSKSVVFGRDDASVQGRSLP